VSARIVDVGFGWWWCVVCATAALFPGTGGWVDPRSGLDVLEETVFSPKQALPEK
jgi:hypothetical protein